MESWRLSGADGDSVPAPSVISEPDAARVSRETGLKNGYRKRPQRKAQRETPCTTRKGMLSEGKVTNVAASAVPSGVEGVVEVWGEEKEEKDAT